MGHGESILLLGSGLLCPTVTAAKPGAKVEENCIRNVARASVPLVGLEPTTH